MPDTQIRGLGSGSAPLSYTIPGAQEAILKALYASFDGSGTTAAWYPGIRFVAPGGGIAGEYKALETVVAGGSADASFAPFLRRLTVQEQEFLFNVAELGFTGSGTQASSYTHTIQFNDVAGGDAIMVSAQAPSNPGGGGLLGYPTSCTDSQGNTYIGIILSFWEAAVANVNEGAVQQFFFCTSSVAPLQAGIDTITVTWDNPVFDRSIYAWTVHHDGGASIPNLIAFTPDNDAAVFASTQVTLTSPDVTPTRDNALLFATIFSAKVGGTGAFGGVAGYTGYLQIQSRSFAGSKQIYRINVNTYGANALEVNPFGGVPFEIDLGQLPGGVPTGAFNGVAQNYSLGANAWKGINLLMIT